MVLLSLEGLLQLVKNRKQNADDSEVARHWATVYTELEKIVAYMKVYLSEGE